MVRLKWCQNFGKRSKQNIPEMRTADSLTKGYEFQKYMRSRFQSAWFGDVLSYSFSGGGPKKRSYSWSTVLIF